MPPKLVVGALAVALILLAMPAHAAEPRLRIIQHCLAHLRQPQGGAAYVHEEAPRRQRSLGAACAGTTSVRSEPVQGSVF
jgi:hypothetical protein